MADVLRVGCAMWTHRAWRGRAIPAETPKGRDLQAYSQVVNSVEGNTTFYAVPSVDIAQQWADAVPKGFRFMFKLPRTVTHERKLRGVDEQVAGFLRALEPCHPTMEPISIQLPAAFGPESLDVLDRFLARAPQQFRWAVEVRHPRFFDTVDEARRLNDVLFARGADRIILDSRAVFAGPRVTPAEIEAFENKPRLPVLAVATNDRPVVRFIGQTDADSNPQFWAPWIDTVVRWIRDGRQPLVFIHTPDNVVAPDLCRRFHHEVQAAISTLEPLPEPPEVDSRQLFD